MKIIKTEMVKISNLKSGPIRQDILPVGFIERVINYKNKLKEVENMSLEETISNFQRDLHPERELEFWERISNKYEIIVNDNQGLSIVQKKELFEKLLLVSMGG